MLQNELSHTQIPIEAYIPGFPLDYADETASIEWGRSPDGQQIAVYVDGELAYNGPVLAREAAGRAG